MSSALLAIAGYFVFRYQSLGYIMNSAESDDLFHNVFVNVDGMTKYAMIFYSWGKYLFLLIFPHPLTHDYYPYQIPEVGFENLIVIASLIISLALVVFALIKIKSKHMVAFGILFYFITFSVVSNLVFNLGLLMNERLIFMPSLGYSIILAYLLVKHLYPLLEKKRKVSWFFGVAIILLGLYSAKSISRNTDWKNDNTLYYKDVETSVNSARCNVVAGSLMIIEAKTKTIQNERLVLVNKGIKYVERGLKLHPDNPQGWIALGEAFYHRGELERSFRFYKETYKYDEISRVATDNLKAIVVTFKEKGNIDKAKQLVDELIKQNSENNSFYILKAEVLMANKEYEQALNILNSRVDSGIEDAGIYNKLSEIHGRYLNNLSIAKEYSLKGYALDDKDITILENLGVIAGLEGNFQEAAEYFKKAYGLDPTNKNVVNNLISTYLQMGDEKSANFYKSRIPGN